MERKNAKKARLSFRAQLVLFGLLLVMIVALPPLIIEIQRPWDELSQLISRGKIIVSEVKTDFTLWDLQKMNNFALESQKKADPNNEDCLIWTFNLLITGQNLSYEEINKTVLENNEEIKKVDEANLVKAFAFWQEQFANQPELIPLFKKYKEKLMRAKISAKVAGFNFDDTYVMVDDGQKLVFLLDGATWWESSYPGLEYDVVKNDCPYFRNYLKNGPGFDTNPIRYHLKIFPKFDTDQWGNWFSVWLADTSTGSYNNFALDFDASHVRKLMWTIGAYIISTILVLALVIALITQILSRKISQPIKLLMAGAKSVIDANYDVIVPKIGSREFEEFIVIFNDMVVKLKGRVNLKQMLGKLLSKELAERVEKEGMVLEGHEVETTIMFTDFAGFSTITRNMPPEKIFQMLNEYFSELIPIIKKWGGFPDKYIGDAIVAIFGAPLKLGNHAEMAVSCAIEMQLKMRQLTEIRKKQKKPVLEMRIGINSGQVIVGALGSDEKMDYTSIGETTNLANRMESACQIGDILISGNTFKLVNDIFFENIDIDEFPQQFEVKGYSDTIAAYNIQVANLKISKNAEAISNDDFYIIETADHHLKKFDSLSPEAKKKFSKVVKITPS
jgi:class 3 adenylate cyclase